MDATKKVRAYAVQASSERQKLHSELEMSQVAATKDSKDAENGASLFRKSEQENKALQAEIQHLKFEKVTADSAPAKVEEEESTRLRIELEQAHADFAKEKKELEMTYMKQVDDMYFYGYGRCM